MTGEDDSFAARCRAVLASHAESVDGQTRSRLNQARQAALAEAAARRVARPFRVPGLWLPGGVLASAAALALAVWIARPVAPLVAPLAESTPLEDAEMLSSSEGPDLYADDAEFYDWAGSDSAGGTG